MKKTSGRLILFLFFAVNFGGAHMIFAEKLDPVIAKPSEDGEILWFDCKDLRVEGKGWTDTESLYARFPARAKGKISGSDYYLSLQSAGISVRFSTDAPTLQVRWTVTSHALAMPHMPATGVSGVDLYAKGKKGGWQFVGNGRPLAVSNTAQFALSFAEQYLLYLPLYNGTKSIEVGIPKNCAISKPDLSAAARPKPIVFYGTSIVQGACASRPGMASVAITGRMLNAESINLGLNGSGRMEREIADLLAELDPSVYVLDGVWNMSPEQVAERVEPFVTKLRERHPTTPILLVEDPSFQNISPTPKGVVLRRIFHKLTAAGDKNLHFLSNKDMLGDDLEGTVDGCHPNDLGMMRQAAAYTKALSPLLQKQIKRNP